MQPIKYEGGKMSNIEERKTRNGKLNDENESLQLTSVEAAKASVICFEIDRMYRPYTIAIAATGGTMPKPTIPSLGDTRDITERRKRVECCISDKRSVERIYTTIIECRRLTGL
uniref:Uncharacterized protein n=1 Tax=Romanomermis culicivorax TaxID=13658 RepID=A0A915HU56_ROMCU